MNRKAALAVALLALTGSSAALTADQLCFLPKKARGSSGTFVDPDSKVCRAFQRELSADCGGDIPTVEFKPRLVDSGLTLPPWESVPLYAPDGSENAESFALLENLVWSRAMTQYSRDREARAKRDVERVLGRVRAGHAGDQSPRFDKVSLDLEGRDRIELLYRLYTGLEHNPTTINDRNSSFKTEPELFLERARDLAVSTDVSKISAHAAGGDATGLLDVLIFDGVPYFLGWSGDTVYVYAAYLHRNRPNIPDENFEHRTYIMPKLRCLFDSRPIH